MEHCDVTVRIEVIEEPRVVLRRTGCARAANVIRSQWWCFRVRDAEAELVPSNQNLELLESEAVYWRAGECHQEPGGGMTKVARGPQGTRSSRVTQ